MQAGEAPEEVRPSTIQEGHTSRRGSRKGSGSGIYKRAIQARAGREGVGPKRFCFLQQKACQMKPQNTIQTSCATSPFQTQIKIQEASNRQEHVIRKQTQNKNSRKKSNVNYEWTDGSTLDRWVNAGL